MNRGSTMNWDPDQYLKFLDARQRPALDLLARLVGQPANNIVDLGCGAGNVTRLLAGQWPQARITGIDSDSAMLDKAASSLSSITWQQADIAAWQGEQPLDLVFSNAALHWLGDHQHLLLRLVEQLAVGGVLAVQMPANFAAPSHRILLELAGDPGWQAAFDGVRQGAVLTAAEYHALLTPHCRHLDVWETTYFQVLDGDDGIVEWMKGTTLVPYIARLDRQTAEHFLAAYRARLLVAYPRRADGCTLFPFKRIFFVAQR